MGVSRRGPEVLPATLALPSVTMGALYSAPHESLSRVAVPDNREISLPAIVLPPSGVLNLSLNIGDDERHCYSFAVQAECSDRIEVSANDKLKFPWLI